MNRNRHNLPRDATTRIIHHHATRSDRYSWLRTLREIRNLAEGAA